MKKFHLDILISALKDLRVEAATALLHTLEKVSLDSPQVIKLCGALIRAAREKDLPVY